MPLRRVAGQSSLVLEYDAFDLANTLDCGQIFCWRKQSENAWRGWIDDTQVDIEKSQDGRITLHFADAELSPERVRNFFCLEEDMGKVIRSFPPEDPFLREAQTEVVGMRLLRQAPWECLACFICSSQKQVVQIQQINANLRRLFSEEGKFPNIEKLANCEVADLREAKLGYRAKHLLGAAKHIYHNQDWYAGLDKLPTPDLIEQLMLLPGVGRKVAHCVALFAYHRTEAFPVDVWVERVVGDLYFPRLRKRPRLEEMFKFGPAYFGAHCGLAQQMLFHWLRKMSSAKREELFKRARIMKIPLAEVTLKKIRAAR